MVYFKYGKAFHDLRIQHGFSLSAFEELGIAKSTLSNFENGKSMLSFDRLDFALQKMNVSPLDYSLMINNGEQDNYISIFDEIEHAYYQRNIKQLQYIYEINKEGSNEQKLIAFSARGLYRRLTIEELNEIEFYLKGVQFWGFFELSILANIGDKLDNSIINNIIDDLRYDKAYYENNLYYRVLIYRFFYKIIFKFIDSEKKEKAQEILMISKQFFMPGDVMSHVIIYFAESFYCYYYTDKKQGKMQLQETLKFLKKIGAEDFRKTLKLQYDKRILRENRSEK
ncbi:helix-turn-helix domain-containing protein [Lactococcus lactis subsp. lactis]|uniref:Rgg/GadR/MutR family transcriptional regulator n=1 Tax=Lactococcus lactis TaxID=1358 RepID=UPI0004E26A2B|nr:Rgg/GadR/MutR family transcriptional regulator [Lactococcus lactis]MCT3136469.1 Rgg/GadR/MutR family transcriptional regulator [Lactococcus lactis]OJH47753.1 XRE/Rgg family transcriptional regulator [Lactococcus lactis subsp. lactis bv. diacetylactis]TRW76415.1 helix-turn-helix domain-containing protein [Lactococcus lactis]